MKKISWVFLTGFLSFALLMMPACTTAQAMVVLGTWLVNFSFPDWGLNWIDTFIFSGNDSGGSVTGLTLLNKTPQQTGTWTRTGDYSIGMHFEFDWYGFHEVVDLTGNSSESNPDSINGTGTWMEDAVTDRVTFIATRQNF